MGLSYLAFLVTIAAATVAVYANEGWVTLQPLSESGAGNASWFDGFKALAPISIHAITETLPRIDPQYPPTLLYYCDFFVEICQNIRAHLGPQATSTMLSYNPRVSSVNRKAACPSTASTKCKANFQCDQVSDAELRVF